MNFCTTKRLILAHIHALSRRRQSRIFHQHSTYCVLRGAEPNARILMRKLQYFSVLTQLGCQPTQLLESFERFLIEREGVRCAPASLRCAFFSPPK